MKGEKKEERILWISFTAGLMFAVVEFLFAIFSHSQSVLMDAVYDASELIFIGLILFLTPLFYLPASEKHPYGFFQVESIFLIIKGFMMLSVTFGVSAEVIQSAISGGNRVNEFSISIFQMVLGWVSVVIYWVLKKMNHSINSPTVQSEIMEWKLDISYSLGLSLAFFGSAFLEKTPVGFLSPYVDPVVAVVIMLLMIPSTVKMLWDAIKDVFLFSPDSNTVDSIKKICTDILSEKELTLVSVDVIKTGRRLWVTVYYDTPKDLCSATLVRKFSALLNQEVKKTYRNCFCEMILAPEASL